MAKLLDAKKLCAYYGATQVLFDIDFAIEAGQITTILGANGAGKTTTLRALCQVVRTIWHSARSVVVLPAPLAPRMVVIWPASIAKSMSNSTWVAP